MNTSPFMRRTDWKQGKCQIWEEKNVDDGVLEMNLIAGIHQASDPPKLFVFASSSFLDFFVNAFFLSEEETPPL